ncbi:MAG: hypothetical protein E6Q97_25430 [Desulfurellales bacterium]|nr:MAG: hypothetical protein E6Q97_25430 [Desulfurellales bacterium]
MRELNLSSLFEQIEILRRRIDILSIQEIIVTDYQLDDPANGSHFNDNTATYPAGWTQVDDPQETRSNDEYGYWSIVGSNGNNSWKYRKQSPYDIGALTSNAYKSFHFGPLIVREVLPTADLNYYFGIYRDNSGIDENTFVRLNINWSSASSLWQIRAERKDGVTQTNGTYYPLARLPVAPLWLRVVARNSTNRDVFAYVGAVRFPLVQMQLANAALGSGVTWGQVWLQLHLARGSGPDDRIMLGGHDYSDDA